MLPFLHAAAATTIASTSSLVRGGTAAIRTTLRLAVVGDTHEQYEDDDNAALIGLAPDAVLFVGDFGNEDVNVVGIISKLQDSLPCASIFGNHDVAYLSKLYRNRKLPRDAWAPPDEEDTDPNSSCSASARTLRPRLGLGKQYSAVHEMHALLERSNVAWGRRDFDDLSLSVAGGRPFSSGGGDLLAHKKTFYEDLFKGYDGIEFSARTIARNIRDAPDGFANVVLAHNGPTGLGEGASDIVGRDWQPRGRKQRDDPADWGDADLEAGLASASEGAHVPLVVFGHMHHALRDGGERRMALHDPSHNRLYLNAAHVPRWRRTTRGRERAFTLVELSRGGGGDGDARQEELADSGTEWAATSAELVWVLASGEVVEKRTLWPESS